jgi:undecaprenyl-diphosphooligosaccharide---protein glycotransferase
LLAKNPQHSKENTKMKIKLFEFNNNVWFFIGVLLACFAVSMGVRFQQFETWKQTPDAYFVGERPMMTTLDAPYWLRWAREYNEGTLGKIKGLSEYPGNSERLIKLSISSKFSDNLTSTFHPSFGITKKLDNKGPLLSYLIAKLAPFFDYNYYLTGTLLIPVLASLFVLPLGIYFFLIGVPVSGLLGGLIGTFAGGYYMRSSIGRIDTDMLNLFFMLMSALLIFQSSHVKSNRYTLLLSAVTGMSLYLFHWWYSQAGFTLAYFIILVFNLFVHRKQFKVILLSALLFLFFANPSVIMDGTKKVKSQFNKYFFIEDIALSVVNDKGTNKASFPNTMSTISEVDHVPMYEVFRRVLSNTTLDWIGFLAFFALAFFRWRVLLPLLPMLVLGLLSFQSSNRFIMFLAPFIGIGLGWLLQLGVEGAFYVLTQSRKGDKKAQSAAEKTNHSEAKVITQRRKDPKGLKKQLPETGLWATTPSTSLSPPPTSHHLNWIRQGTLYLGMGLFFWLISSQTAISYVPGPSIHPRLYATFFEVKKRVPENSALLTWWDYGHAIIDATGLATFHDGGGQTSPKTYFIARGLISDNPEELYDITQYLATEGNPGIANNNTSPEALLAAVRNPKLKPWDPIYLFFTADMTGKYGAISKLGSWDIVKGGSKPRGYQNLACNKITNEEMNCRGANIDLKAGKINNQVPLKRMIFIRNGKIMREQEFGHAQGYTLQMLVSGNRIVEVQLVDEVVFRSNYNQMFLLGRYDGELFEETYNAFPFSRLFRVKF